jgi:hypothetical protein
MARGTLHPSKPADQRRRRNAPAHGENVVVPDGEVRGPDLAGEIGSPLIREWYDMWRRSPQAQLFEETDWFRLRILALTYEAFERRPTAALLSEIRMNEERLGATVVDRMRARITIDRESEAAPLAPVRDIQAEIAARLRGGS